MKIFISNLSIIVLFSVALFSFFAAFTSINEKEKRAFRILFVNGLFFMLLVSINIFVEELIGFYLSSSIVISILIISVLIFFPKKRNSKHKYFFPKKRIDERNTMFSRNELIENSKNFDNYYQLFPEHKTNDIKFRKNAGLLSENSKLYDPISFAMAEASFFTVEKFKHSVDFPEKGNKKEFDKQQISQFLKTWAKNLGAHSIGICQLKDYHLYSYRGRGDYYGTKVVNSHKYAIAFTVEMDKEHIDSAPFGATVAESAQQYLNAGNIALQIASFINNLGYGSRAHIDGNYEVVCPIVARDAGLGELGRMGLLMTPQLGPRVRIAVVTTDIPLEIDEAEFANDVVDFCVECKKCARVCPSQAISFENRKEIDGVVRWQINQEACFNYWTISGTDCARCVSVCPYSHENNWLHNMVRKGIKYSSGFRHTAAYLDDVLYGKKPKSKAMPEYIRIKTWT